MAYGRQVLGSLAGTLELTADGRPVPKAAGVTIDWTTVAAVAGSDVTLNDGQVIPIGAKYLRYGQVITQITTGGKYGPYDPAAVDGRALLVRGRAFLVNRTALSTEPADEHPEAIEGGRVYRARIVQSEAATHTLALGPTFAEINATFPTLLYVE